MSDSAQQRPARASMAAEQAREARARLGVQAPQQGVPSDDGAPEAAAPRRRHRGNRRPFGSREQKLAYPDRQGYHRHWFNDDPGRIERAKEAGYEQVHDDKGKPVSCVVGTARGGGALVAFLMEIPLEWYQEDRDDQDSVVHDLMGQIRKGEYEKPSGRDGQLRYAGSTRGEIAIREGDRR